MTIVSFPDNARRRRAPADRKMSGPQRMGPERQARAVLAIAAGVVAAVLMAWVALIVWALLDFAIEGRPIHVGEIVAILSHSAAIGVGVWLAESTRGDRDTGAPS